MHRVPTGLKPGEKGFWWPHGVFPSESQAEHRMKLLAETIGQRAKALTVTKANAPEGHAAWIVWLYRVTPAGGISETIWEHATGVRD